MQTQLSKNEDVFAMAEQLAELNDPSNRDELAWAIAEHCVGLKYEGLNESTVTATKKLIFDSLAATIGGIPEPGGRELRAILFEQGGRPEASVVGSNEKLPAESAAIVNSTMSRALDYDDVSESALIHTTAAVVPAAMAAAQAGTERIDGKEFIAAIALGIDLANRLSLASVLARDETSGPRLVSATCLVGVFSAAAVASRIWKLSVPEVVSALGFAHSQAAGNQQAAFDGSSAVKVQQGLGTAAGIFSARVALHGLTGPSHPFEGKAGYFAVHWQDTYDRSQILTGLGDEYSVDQVSIKPYPCCKHTHNAIAASLLLREQNPELTPETIDHVDVFVPSHEYFELVCAPIAAKQEPKTPVDAQYSLPFSVAVALTKGTPRPEDFTPDAIRNPSLLELTKRVRPILQEPVMTTIPVPVTVVIHTRSGEQFSETVQFSPGHPLQPMTWDALVGKLELLSERTDPSFPHDKQVALATSCQSLETCANIDTWIEEHLCW